MRRHIKLLFGRCYVPSCFSVVGGLVAKPSLTLLTPWTVAYQTPLSMEFSKQEYWSGLPFPSPGDLPDPGIEPASRVSGGFSTPEPAGKLSISFLKYASTWIPNTSGPGISHKGLWSKLNTMQKLILRMDRVENLIFQSDVDSYRFCCCCVVQLCPTLCDPMNCSPPGSSVHGDSPGKNTTAGCHAFLQGIFPTQGLNPGLPHCRRILYQLSYPGSP